MNVRLLFILCILATFANKALALHDPLKTVVVLFQTPGGESRVALADDRGNFYETSLDNAEKLHWVIASALSLKTGIRVIQDGQAPRLAVGEFGAAELFFVSAAHIKTKMSTNAKSVEYWFDNGQRNFQLSASFAGPNYGLDDYLSMAHLFGGFIVLSRTQGQLSFQLTLYSDLFLIERNPWSGNIEFQKERTTRLYSVASKPLLYFDLQLEEIRKPSRVSKSQRNFIQAHLEPELKHHGGAIACAKHLLTDHDEDACLLFSIGVLPPPMVVELPETGALETKKAIANPNLHAVSVGVSRIMHTLFK